MKKQSATRLKAQPDQQLKLRNDYILDQPYEVESVINFFGISLGTSLTDCMYVAYTE
ncbi:MAG: hypothetical protein WC384_20525 [Prolixibacteraceae bacterium]|jgi:hypothetical protein